MELEEMKALWGEMSAELQKQKKLTDALILKMTGAGYRSKINKILVPETVGALGCCIIAWYILLNLNQFTGTWYLLVCAISAAVILFLLCLLSLKAVYKMRSVNISKNNYKQSLLQYSKGKIQFVFVQKVSFCLSAVLMLVILPVMGKLIAGKDLFTETKLWMWYTVSFLFFYPFSRWAFKSYIKVITDAENILKELEG